MVRLVLLRLLESYFRHRWLYLLPIVFMAGAALVYILNMPPTYVVSGTLYIQNDNLLSSLTDIRNDGFSYVTPAQATMIRIWAVKNTVDAAASRMSLNDSSRNTKRVTIAA